jgi:glycine cleavage system aminomethyltransferase T
MDGYVSILVKSSNDHGAALKGDTLKFDVSSSTRVVVRGGGVLAVLDKGIIKVRGRKRSGRAATGPLCCRP